MKYIFALLIWIVSSDSFAQKALPLIRTGMSRSDLAASLPVYAKAFAGSEPKITIPGFYYHGMKGEASFVFMQGDHLLVFIWEHKAAQPPLGKQELRQYAMMIAGLERDFGTAHHHSVSPYEPRAEEYFWRLPESSGHTAVMRGSIKFQIADNIWLDKMHTQSQPVLELSHPNSPYGK